MVRALTNQNGHLFHIVRLMPIISLWVLLALVTDMKIEFSACRPGHFYFPIAFMVTPLYVLLYSKTVMPLHSLFVRSYISFVSYFLLPFLILFLWILISCFNFVAKVWTKDSKWRPRWQRRQSEEEMLALRHRWWMALNGHVVSRVLNVEL